MENQAQNRRLDAENMPNLIATPPRLEFPVTRSFKRRKHFLTATRIVFSLCRFSHDFLCSREAFAVNVEGWSERSVRGARAQAAFVLPEVSSWGFAKA